MLVPAEVGPLKMFLTRILLAWAFLLAPFPLLAGQASPPDSVIGTSRGYITEDADTLLDVAREFDIGYVEIRAANPGIDPWLPGGGREVVLPTRHILPSGPRQGIVINLPELRLYFYHAGEAPRSFPIGIGGEGKETPVGSTSVVRKAEHPIWTPTKSEHEENPDLPRIVEAGPDNPMGDFALYLGWKGYAVHGTNKPFSIGRRDSHGCIRMYPEDIDFLFHHVPPGTSVSVVNQKVKLGWSQGELYLEIHPDQAEADELESRGYTEIPNPVDADDMVLKEAGSEAHRIDWYRVHLAEQKRDGIAVQITVSP